MPSKSHVRFASEVDAPNTRGLRTKHGRRLVGPANLDAVRAPARTRAAASPPALPAPFAAWFAARGWTPRPHQLELLEKAREGRSTLLIAPTGAGKTLAGFLPTLISLHERPAVNRPGGRGIHTLYVSPLKALAVDIARNLEAPVAEMGLAVSHRDADRRHARPQAPAAEAQAAGHPADDAGAGRAPPLRHRTRRASSPTSTR